MKIRIKKVTALLLSCMLLFSISGCQKKRTAKEVLESSLKQSSKLKDADFSGEASYKIANSEASSSSNVTIKMNFDTKLSVYLFLPYASFHVTSRLFLLFFLTETLYWPYASKQSKKFGDSFVGLGIFFCTL